MYGFRSLYSVHYRHVEVHEYQRVEFIFAVVSAQGLRLEIPRQKHLHGVLSVYSCVCHEPKLLQNQDL